MDADERKLFKLLERAVCAKIDPPVEAPRGENPRPTLDPSRCVVGIRVHRQSEALSSIFEFRSRLLRSEKARVLGRRAPSTHKTKRAWITILPAACGLADRA